MMFELTLVKFNFSELVTTNTANKMKIKDPKICSVIHYDPLTLIQIVLERRPVKLETRVNPTVQV